MIHHGHLLPNEDGTVECGSDGGPFVYGADAIAKYDVKSEPCVVLSGDALADWQRCQAEHQRAAEAAAEAKIRESMNGGAW